MKTDSPGISDVVQHGVHPKDTDRLAIFDFDNTLLVGDTLLL
jgi:hypothetical protein